MTNENSVTPSYLQSKNKSGMSRFFTSPAALIRLCAVLFTGLAIGHVSVYPWTSPYAPREVELVSTMKSVDLVSFGQHSSYWNLYYGWALWLAALLLTVAIVLWFLADIVCVLPQKVGVITGTISVTCVIGAYLSLRYFVIPSFLMLSLICVILLTVTVRLLKKT